ncbi:MAG: hypothetical protein ABR524_01870 [Thermoanaerobaculia bacterium]
MALGAGLLSLGLTLGCTGGQETSAGTIEPEQSRTEGSAEGFSAKEKLGQLSPAIPLYTGAEYREDFTRRDSVMVRNQYGDEAEVVTLASDDALPKIWHYYVTYLAQYRAWDPVSAYPPERKNWRTLEVNLTEAMQDPFVPGTNLKLTDREVILQIAETEAQPETLIRYIIRERQPRADQQAQAEEGAQTAPAAKTAQNRSTVITSR